MGEPKYRIIYDFDVKGEPPKVFIVGGEQVRVEVDEEPVCRLGGKLVDTPEGWDWQGTWSWEDEDWAPGPIAARLLAVMNAHM